MSVCYASEGFFSPVENLPAVNLVEAGQAVPLKSSLGADRGLAVFAAGSPASGQYSYVWKTEKAWAGTCRQLVVRLREGTTRRANFRFK